MNKAHSYLISCDFRSAGLAQVCLAPAKTTLKPQGSVPIQRKTIGARPHPSSNAHSIFSQVPAQPDCAMLKSP